MAEIKEEGRPFAGPAMRAKLFKHGGSQAVRLPKEFRFEGEEVLICKEGDAVVIRPVRIDWPAFWAQIDERRVSDDWETPPDPPVDGGKDLSW